MCPIFRKITKILKINHKSKKDLPETQLEPIWHLSVLLLFNYALDKPIGKNNDHQSHDSKNVVLEDFHIKLKEINHLHTS